MPTKKPARPKAAKKPAPKKAAKPAKKIAAKKPAAKKPAKPAAKKAAKPAKKPMQKKLILALLGLLAAGVVGVNAQTPAPAPAAPAASWTLTPAFASQYMFRGVRLGGPSFQPSVSYTDGPLSAGIWANVPISDKVPGQSDPEFDFTGSYTETINDSLSLVAGVTVYWYPNAEKKNGFYESTVEPNLALNYTVQGVTFTPKVYYDVVLNGPTFEFNVAYNFPLKDMGTELDFVGTVGTFKWRTAFENSSPETKNYGNYWLVGVTIPFQITMESKLSLGFAYTKGSDNFFKTGTAPKFPNPSPLSRGVVTVSYAFTF